MSLYGEDVITETEFKLAFRNLRAPFTALEEHIIYRMVDPDKTGHVEYAKLYEGIWKALANKYVQDDNPEVLDLERPDQWFLATFKVPTYEPLDMPTGFEALISQDYTGFMLQELIRRRVPQLATKAIVVFTEASKYTESLIKCQQKLSEFNFTGGPKCAPTEINLYYDYTMGRVDCPLVTSVFYYGPPQQPQSSSSQSFQNSYYE